MSDSDYEYWEESIGQAFDEAGIEHPPDDKFKILVEAIQGCASVQDEYMGKDLIPDPRDKEVDDLRRLLKQEREASEAREWIYADEIASRYGYPSDYSVRIVGGRVEVEEVPR